MPASSASSTALDLSRLPPPDVIEPLSYETILAALKDDLVARDPTYTALGHADPAIKLLEIAAYRELLLRQRLNEAARAVMIAYASDADLDQLAAVFGVERLLLDLADPEAGKPAVLESDEALRSRVLLAPDSYSVAGPAGAYIFHALSAHAGIADVSATSPAPGEVIVSILSRGGTGAASADMIDAVSNVVNADDIRPLTDFVTVQSAQILEYVVDARLTLFSGPDAELVRATAEAELDELLARSRRIGRDITRSALFGALHVAGVQNVELVSPDADLVVSETQAASLTARSVTVSGIGE